MVSSQLLMDAISFQQGWVRTPGLDSHSSSVDMAQNLGSIPWSFKGYPGFIVCQKEPMILPPLWSRWMLSTMSVSESTTIYFHCLLPANGSPQLSGRTLPVLQSRRLRVSKWKNLEFSFRIRWFLTSLLSSLGFCARLISPVAVFPASPLF